MLKQRIITAVILATIAVATLAVASPWPFVGLGLLAIGTAAWEWAARLNPAHASTSGLDTGALVFSAGLVVFCLAVLAMVPLPVMPRSLWFAATLAWGGAGVALLAAGVSRWQQLPRSVRWLLGWCMLATTFAALVQGRMMGVNFLLSCMVLVFAADIAAYFAGKAWGGKLVARKLAASISPGKSWEGATGGALGVLLLAAGWMWADTTWGQAAGWSASLYTRLFAFGGVPALVLGALALTAMSVMGDLVESLVKRAANVKDSSQLLPGHGGVLDRIDAQLPVLPACMAIAALAGGGAI